jgi:hypothetical protein
MTFAPSIGSVAHTLFGMRGVWHDHVEVFSPDGRPLARDERSGTPGGAPWDNLVYVDFDGERYVQTNVAFRGRPLHAKTFRGRLVDGVLVFDRLGPDDPEHVGVSGGAGIVIFGPRRITAACGRYHEPDVVRLLGEGARTRTTLLWRDGLLVRALTAHGTRLSPTAAERSPIDPRGGGGPVHEPHRDTPVFAAGHDPSGQERSDV